MRCSQYLFVPIGHGSIRFYGFDGNFLEFQLTVANWIVSSSHQIETHVNGTQCFDRMEFNLVHSSSSPPPVQRFMGEFPLSKQTRNDKINNHSSYCGHAFRLCFSVSPSSRSSHVCNWSFHERHKNRETNTQYRFVCGCGMHVVGYTMDRANVGRSLVSFTPVQKHILQFFGSTRAIAARNRAEHIGYILLERQRRRRRSYRKHNSPLLCVFYLYCSERCCCMGTCQFTFKTS